MFDYVAKHKVVAQIVLGLITLSFVFFGTYSYFQRAAVELDVATVGDQKITQSEFSDQLREQQDRARSQMGRSFDPAMFDNPEVRFAIVEQLVNQRLLQERARRDRLRVTDAQLQQFIAAIPAFQEDGKFSPERYKMILSQQNPPTSPPLFEQRLRQDLTLAPLQEPVVGGNIVARSSAERYLTLLEQRREVATATIDAEPFAKDVKVDDAAVKAYYDQHATLFQIPEQARVEYVVLSPEAVSGQVKVTPEEVRKQYDENQKQFGQAEERSAAHILIAVKPDAAAADQAAAKKQAEDLLAQARAAPAKFGELAKANSQDPGSATQGGDLGSIARGAMVKPFDEAVFAAKTGDIVGPVQTEFGYHVILVTGIKAAQIKSFDEVKGQIEADLKRAQAQQKFAAAADQFQNLVYEQAESLQPVGKTLDIKVGTTPMLTRAQVQQLGLGNPKFAQALFAPESIAAKRNTEAIEVAASTLASGRVVKHEAARQLPLAAVKVQVRERLVVVQAAALARKQGEARLAELRAAPATAMSEAAVTLSRAQPRDLPGAVVDAVLKAPAATLPAFVGVDLGDQGYAVVRIGKVLGRDPATADASRAQAQYAQAWGEAESQAYYNALKTRFKVEIKPNALPAAATADAASAAVK